MSFKPKSNGAALAALVEQTLPTTPPTQRQEPEAPDHRLLQINFRASPAFAQLIAEAAEADGGLRCFFARCLKQLGYPVPAIDLDPPRSKRRYDRYRSKQG